MSRFIYSYHIELMAVTVSVINSYFQLSECPRMKVPTNRKVTELYTIAMMTKSIMLGQWPANYWRLCSANCRWECSKSMLITRGVIAYGQSNHYVYYFYGSWSTVFIRNMKLADKRVWCDDGFYLCRRDTQNVCPVNVCMFVLLKFNFA